jgi:hypothetical protein
VRLEKGTLKGGDPTVLITALGSWGKPVMLCPNAYCLQRSNNNNNNDNNNNDNNNSNNNDNNNNDNNNNHKYEVISVGGLLDSLGSS